MSTTQIDKPRLSILIPAVASRMDAAMALYNRIIDMAGDRNIEVLLLLDNKRRSIGMKRNALKNICRGEYFLMVDDDDELLSLDEIYDATEFGADVITFQSLARNSDGSHYLVDMRLGHEVEHRTNEKGMYLDIKRPPFQMCAWQFRFMVYQYPDKSYGEDWEWVEQCLNAARTEYNIPKVLHKYNFSLEGTQAPKANEL